MSEVYKEFKPKESNDPPPRQSGPIFLFFHKCVFYCVFHGFIAHTQRLLHTHTFLRIQVKVKDLLSTIIYCTVTLVDPSQTSQNILNICSTGSIEVAAPMDPCSKRSGVARLAVFD